MMLKALPKQVLTEDCNPKAVGVIKNIDDLTSERNDTAFSTLRAADALNGHPPYRTSAADGHVTYWDGRRGLVHYPPSIDSARLCSEKIGGRL